MLAKSWDKAKESSMATHSLGEAVDGATDGVDVGPGVGNDVGINEHIRFKQNPPVKQSFSTRQLRPTPQGGQFEPPQSISVSLSSKIPSLQS